MYLFHFDLKMEGAQTRIFFLKLGIAQYNTCCPPVLKKLSSLISRQAQMLFFLLEYHRGF